MASAGLLGALSGFGQGLARIGQDMAQRRDRALQWAREEAARQDNLRARREERDEDRDARFATTAFTTRAASDRQEAQLNSAAKREVRTQEWRDRHREDQQDHAALLLERRAALAQAQTESAIRLRQRLEAPDVVGIRESVVRRHEDGSQTVQIQARNRAGQWRVQGTVREFPSTGGGNSGSSAPRSLTARPGG